MGRVPLRALIGLGLIAFGIAAHRGIDRWMRSRIVDPVNMTIPLGAGHVHTGPFHLNLNATYWVIMSSGEAGHPESKCAYSFLRTQSRWVLYKRGRIFKRNDSLTFVNWPTSFDAGPGIYDMDLEILWDASCLDRSHPRLHIYALTEDYETAAQVLEVGCLGAAGLGFIVLVFLPAIERLHSAKTECSMLGPTTNAAEYQWNLKLPLQKPFSRLPTFGLFAAILYGVLALLMMLITFGFQTTSRGLSVHLLNAGQVPGKSVGWTVPLTVLLKDSGPSKEPQIMVNGKQVTWEDFSSALKRELAQRQDWIVYVGGDDCLAYVNFANVIDLARGYGVKVFLIDDPTHKPCDIAPPLAPVRH